MKRIALMTSRAVHRDAVLNFFQHAALSLGPMYLESYLHQYGPKSDVHFVDTVEEVLALKPDLVGISAVTQNFTFATEQAREIKNRLGIPVVVGGSHITALPQTLPIEMDCGVIGEGEETFRQLILALEANSWGPDTLAKIEGIVYHQNGKVVATAPRKAISPIDLIPKPRRVAWAKNVGVAHLVSARGCPFRCSFCTQSESMTKYRTFSIPVIVDEIKDLVRHFGAKYIRFYDDVFNISLKHVKELSAALKSEGLDKEVTFGAWGRANTLNEPMLEAMLGMNIKMLAFGLESGSDRVLAQLKTATKVSDNQRALDLCHQYDILVAATYIIGTPGETEEDIQKTYAFIEDNFPKMADIEVNPIIVLPGTALWQSAVQKGQVTSFMKDWGILKDQAYLPAFDPQQYIYLNEAMSYESYQAHIKSFWKLLEKFVADPKRREKASIMYGNMSAAQFRKAA